MGLNFAGIKFRGFRGFWPNPRKIRENPRNFIPRNICFAVIREIKSPRNIWKKRPDPRNLSFFPKNTLPTKTLDHKAWLLHIIVLSYTILQKPTLIRINKLYCPCCLCYYPRPVFLTFQQTSCVYPSLASVSFAVRGNFFASFLPSLFVDVDGINDPKMTSFLGCCVQRSHQL